MKKIIAFALVVLMLAATLVSCGGKEIIGLYAQYIGEPVEVLDMDREFTAEDFTVWVTYAEEGGQEITTDFTFEIVERTQGYYRLEFTHKGYTDSSFVWIGSEEEAE